MTNWYEIANAADVASPALLLYPDRIEENLKRLVQLAGDPARLRPHVKTHKLPQIIAIKRSLGIDKFKVSTIAEAEMTAEAGGRDVLLAYPCVGPNIGRLIRLIERFPDTHFATLVDYPPVLLTTSTRDDRVHPGHARKFTAKLLAAGKDVTYYENVEGGHGGAADNAQAAHMAGLVYAFLAERLGLAGDLP